MKTTHLFKHAGTYHAKSSVESAYVRYEYTFEDKSQQELYPWYIYMTPHYRPNEWMQPTSGSDIDRYDTVGGWCEGPEGRFPIKTTMDFRQLKVDSVTILVTMKNGQTLEYDVSNKKDRLMKGYHDQKMSYDATPSAGCRIYSETKEESVAYHFKVKSSRAGTNPSLIAMEEPLDLSFTRFDVMIDEDVDMYEFCLLYTSPSPRD